MKPLEQIKKKTKSTITNTKNLLADEDDEILRTEFRSDLKKAMTDFEKLEAEIKMLKTEKSTQKAAIMDFDKFLKLLRAVPSQLQKMGDMKAMDDLLQMIFSNFVVDSKEVQSYTLKTPFKEVFERRNKDKSLKWSG